MEEKEVLSEMSRQPLAGRAAATSIPPFWFFNGQIPVDAIRGDAAKAGLGKGVAADVGQRYASVASDCPDSLGDVRGFDGAEGGLQLDGAASRAQRNLSIGGLGV